MKRNDVHFMMHEVLKAAIDLLDGSDEMTEKVSHVQTPHLQALQRSMEDLVAMHQAYDQDRGTQG